MIRSKHSILRELLLISLILGVLGLLCAMVFPQTGILGWRKRNLELQHLTKQIEMQRVFNQNLREKIRDLESNPQSKEEVIRRKLWYGRNGEVIYQITPNASNADASRPNSTY